MWNCVRCTHQIEYFIIARNIYVYIDRNSCRISAHRYAQTHTRTYTKVTHTPEMSFIRSRIANASGRKSKQEMSFPPCVMPVVRPFKHSQQTISIKRHSTHSKRARRKSRKQFMKSPISLGAIKGTPPQRQPRMPQRRTAAEIESQTIQARAHPMNFTISKCRKNVRFYWKFIYSVSCDFMHNRIIYIHLLKCRCAWHACHII